MIFRKKPKTTNAGEQAESAAIAFLKNQGLALIGTNYRCRYGEIDIIMQDSNCLVFVEVRYRKSAHFGSALESVTTSKQKKIRITAEHYLQKCNSGEPKAVRFDVVGITQNDTQWIKNAF